MTKMQKAAQIALEQAGSPYVFATSGQPCTEALREKQMKAKPAYADKIKKNCPALASGRACSGCRYSGKRAFDCRGLTYWALKQAGLKISSVGATTQWTTDSWQERDVIGALPRDQPAILFRQDGENPDVMAHTGFYLGDGRAVDARGHASGVVLASVDSYQWTHYAIPYGADDPAGDWDGAQDDGGAASTTRPTLRRGAKGEDVRYLQAVLLAMGCELPRYGADGSYGAETAAAVKAFQIDNRLDPDGIVGARTWAAIERALVPEGETPEDEDALYVVTIAQLTREEAEALMDKYPGARMEAYSGE